MPPRKKLTEEEKKRRRREQKKQSMRRAQARLDDAAIQERRRKEEEKIVQIEVKTDLLCSPSNEPSSSHSASIPIALSPRPLSRFGTPNASTSVASSNCPTSEGSIELRTPVTRRLHFEDVYSEDDDFVVPLHRTKRMINNNIFNDSDSDASIF